MTQKVDVKDVISRLTHLGAFFWHSSKYTGSYYIKFKDCRLGSIRIADHRSRERYNYKYDLILPITEESFQELKLSLEKHSAALTNPVFDKDVFVVYNKELRTYESKHFENISTFKNWFMRHS